MMPLAESQRREVAQLMLVAREYLALADPGAADEPTPLGETAAGFTSGARPSPTTWSRALKAAHLASAAIRLAPLTQARRTLLFVNAWHPEPSTLRSRAAAENR